MLKLIGRVNRNLGDHEAVRTFTDLNVELDTRDRVTTKSNPPTLFVNGGMFVKEHIRESAGDIEPVILSKKRIIFELSEDLSFNGYNLVCDKDEFESVEDAYEFCKEFLIRDLMMNAKCVDMYLDSPIAVYKRRTSGIYVFRFNDTEDTMTDALSVRVRQVVKIEAV